MKAVLSSLSALSIIFTAASAHAASITWDNNGNAGGSGDQLWSTSTNWNPDGAATGNDATFNATGTAASGTVTNIVDASISINSLAFTNTGGTATMHTTQINGGQTLTIAGATGTAFSVLAPTASNTSNVVIKGDSAGVGTLEIAGGTGDFRVASIPTVANYTQTATLDMSGLGSFTASVANFKVGDASNATNVAGIPTGTVTLGVTNTITTGALNVGYVIGSSQTGGAGTLNLGTTNTINADTMDIGRGKSSGTVKFLTGDGSGTTATLRNKAGTGAVATLNLGVDVTYTNANTTGTLNFGKTTLDAQFTTISMGQGASNSGAGAGTGLLTFEVGTLTATTVNLGLGATSTNPAAYGSGTINQNGGTAIIGTMTIGKNTGTGATTTSGTYNLAGGTLKATTILAGTITGSGAATRTINWTGGTIQNLSGGNLTIGTGINIKTTGTNTFNADASRTITVNSALGYTGFESGALVKEGDGTLTLSGANIYTGGTTVSAGALTFLDTTTKSSSGTHAFAASTTLGLGVSGADAFTSTDVDNAFSGTMTGSLSGITVTDTTNVGIDTTNGDFTYDTSVSGSPTKGLVKLGANALTLTGTNTYSGQTAINGGILQINASENLGDASATNTIVITGGTLESTDNSYDLTSNRTITLNGAGTIQADAGTLTVSGTVSNGGNLLTVTGAGDTTISGGIGNGAGGLTKSGEGTLTLSGANTYTGTTTIDQGTLAFTTVSPDLAGGLTFGAAAASTNMVTLDLSGIDSTATFAALATVRTNNTTANTITLATGKTLTLNGGLTVGYSASSGLATHTGLTVNGGGTMAVNGTDLIVGVNSTGAAQAWFNTGTLDVTALASFTTNVTNFKIGVGGTTTTPVGNVLLSNTANTILASLIGVGNSGTTNAANDKGPCKLTLGTGTNIIQADTIYIGRGKNVNGGTAGTGTVAFASQTPESPGTVTIANYAGSGGATIEVANNNTIVTSAGAVGTLDLRGHDATVNAGTLLIAQTNAASNQAPTNGTVSFDTGTFTVETLNMGVKSGGSTGTATGTLNIGGGTFTVNTAFTLGSQDTAGSSVATVNLTSGTLTSNVSILRSGTANTTSTINLQGGILDLTGHDIGISTSTITLNAESGELKNVVAINTTDGLAKTTTGTLILSGTNAYTGDTTVTEGTLKLGAGGTIPNGTGKGNVVFSAAANTAVLDINGFDTTINGLSQASASTTNTVVNNAIGTAKTLTVGNADATSTFAGVIADNTGTGGSLALTKTGTGALTLSGTNTYTGKTAVDGGTLLLTGSLAGTATVGTTGTLAGNGTVTGATTIATTGILSPGNSDVATLNFGGNVTLNAGSTYAVDVTSATASDKIILAAGKTLATAGSTVAFNPVGHTFAAGDAYDIADGTTITGVPAITPTVPGAGLAWDTSTFTTDGTIKVVTAAGYTYDSWADAYGLTGSAKLRTADPDNDGIPNAVEMVLGGNPATGMDVSLLPTIRLVTDPTDTPVVAAGDYLLFTYRRTARSVASGVTSACETSTTLAAPWTPAVDTVAGVIVRTTTGAYTPVTSPAGAASTIDEVRVYVPRGANTELFGRLKVGN